MSTKGNVIGGALMALLAGPAFGHALVVSSTPADKSVGPAPKTISLTFSEKLVPAFSGFDLSMPGMKMPVTTSISDDGKTITATPTGGWMKGPYQIHWHAVAEDTHRTEGTISFTVK